jgi:hypothetical protein
VKTFKNKLTAMLNAVTFAEAGEHDTAIQCLDHGEPKGRAGESAQSEQSGVHTVASFMGLLQDHMVAATFAEAGEFDSAASMLTRGKRPPSVLLLVDRVSPEKHAFSHAVNLCTRLKANMEILIVSHDVSRSQNEEGARTSYSIGSFVTALSRVAENRGITCTVFSLNGNVIESLYVHLKQHKEVAALVYGSADGQMGGLKNGLQKAVERIVDRLSIPLVKVWHKNQASAHL